MAAIKVRGRAQGVNRISELEIDADKDWNKKGIINVAELVIGDVVFKNKCRLTEVENGIALLDEKGKVIRRWVNAQTKRK